MVTTLYLIRHGALEEESGVKRYHGSLDVPLSKLGIEQMRKSAKFIEKYQSIKVSAFQSINDSMKLCHSETSLAAVYCSDLQRSIKSAEIIAGPHGLSPIRFPALRERSFGIWEGMTFPEIKEKYPAEFEAWAGNPLKFSPIGGESTLQVKERVIHALSEVIGSHQGENISIVAHGGVNRVILCHVMGIPLENIFRIEQDYASVNIIEFWDDYPVVKLINGGK